MVCRFEAWYCIIIYFQVNKLKCTFCIAYLEKYDFNLITVDWSAPANNNDYIIAASKTEGVGKIIARLLIQLVKKKLVTWKCVHIMGHSLGGHVMGVAGACTKGKVGRITGVAKQYFGIVFSSHLFSPCVINIDS